MKDNNSINKARALYYNLFANFFVLSSKSENYFELVRLINILKKSPLDIESGKALEAISNELDPSSNVVLVQEFDDLFHSPLNKKIRLTASYYDEGIESGKKRVEMIQFVAKTKLRRDEKKYFEYEDSVGFIFSFMAQLCDNIANGNHEYENTVHCIFAEILNDFVDDFAKEVYENKNAKIFSQLMIVLHSFAEFERLYLEVSKPKAKVKVQKTKAQDSISDEELERRAKNKLLRESGPKKEEIYEGPVDTATAMETDV